MNASTVGLVHELFAQQVTRTPAATALLTGHRKVTYQQLDTLANRVAAQLVEAGVGAGSLVGIYQDRDHLLVASMLGVLKAGAGYVPLDPAYPAARLRFIAEDARLTHVLTTSHRQAGAAATGARCLPVDDLPDAVHAPQLRGNPADCAYVLYTSGSTGTPKGVVVEHQQVVNLLEWAWRTYSPPELSGVLAATSVCFDVSVVELFAPLTAGGTAILADDLLALPHLPARDQVCLVSGVPSALAALLRLGLPAGVRTVAPAGEALSRTLADQLYAQSGVERVLNCFGPTECTVYCAAHEVPPADPAEPPIGAPIAGASLSVRDPATHEPSDEGELWVAGPVVARGYLNRPELTRQRFLTTPEGERWYRTGDLVRFDGAIHHYLGRLDDQVKVRGHRVELGEVQAALAAHPQIHHAVVLAPADSSGTRRLVGYVEPVSTPPTEAQLRAWLQDRLPGYLLPSQLVVLERLPLGPTGKVDRGALPVPAATTRSVAPVAPRGPLEALVAEATAEALGLPEVGVDDQFGDLGGHSLAAARVVARVAERLRRPVPLGWFLAAPTAAALAQRLADRDLTTPLDEQPAGPVRQHRRVHPLTDLQREFWVARQVHPHSSTTIALRLRLSGPHDPAAIGTGLNEIVRSHEVLRTGFEEWDDGPVAVVRPAAPVPLNEVDLSEVADTDQPARVAQVAASAARQVFDLAHDVPLVRATLIHTGVDAAELIVAVDHTAFDGWSIGILMQELAAALADQPSPEPPLQVSDIAAFERDLDTPARTETLRTFWRDRLANVTPPGVLSGRRAEPRAGRGARVTRAMDPAMVQAMDGVARDCGVSRFAAYASALAVLLHRLTGEPDQVIGTGSALRDRPGLERVIGPLVRVLPIRVTTAGDPTFRQLTVQVTAAAANALAHQDLAADELARCAGFDRPPGAALCPVILTMQPEGMPITADGGQVRIELLGELDTGMAVTDLAFFVNQAYDEQGSRALEIQVEYDLGLYREPEVGNLLDAWLRVLNQVAAEPDRTISTVELLDDPQRQALLAQGRGPALPAERPATVVAAIAARAQEQPAAVAVQAADGELSYAELVKASERLAATLRGIGTEPGDRVGVCVPRDRWLPAALLGVLRAGAAYVPLDAGYPVERLALLAADCGIRVVVARGVALTAAGRIPGVQVLDLDHPIGDDPPPPPGAGDLAYVLYTSGSTGKPKGVEVSHASLADHTTALRLTFGIGGEDAVLALAPLTFDAAGIELWTPLAAGARCVVVERDRVPDGAALAARMSEVKVSIAFLPPTLLRILLASGWTGDPTLRVWCGGEAIDPALVREVLPQVGELWNVYGPTETTTLSTVHRVTGASGETVPIGRPLAGEWVYVVDPHGRLAAPGTVGELWIGGAGVARGYQGRAELTRAAFVPDPYVPEGRCYRTGDLVRWSPDGELEFVGRADHQVKLRGQRVELGEIEAMLYEHRDVVQAAVAVRDTGADSTLVGYLVPQSVDADDIERFLRRRLPDYMVPTRWVRLTTMPTTPSGKVDRQRLPEPVVETDPDDPPTTDMERFLAEVWSEVLATTGIGRRGDFFALGGNSFAATRVVARIRTALACEVPVALIFDRPVLAELAAEVERVALDHLSDEESGRETPA